MICKKSKFSTFDYSNVIGIPEAMVRCEVVMKRLQSLSKNGKARILEVGIGAGDLTCMLMREFADVTCVDSDRKNINLVSHRLKAQKLPGAKFICSKIEDVQLSGIFYDHILLVGVLEHLEDPVNVIKQVSKKLCTKGSLHLCVPLANSLHRWLGIEMKMISKVEDLSESDILLGHYRVYTPALLRKQIKKVGLKISYEDPLYIKPLTTSMLSQLPMELHRTLNSLARRFPKLASYIYVEAKR